MNILNPSLSALSDVTNELVDSRLRTGQAIHFQIPTSSMYPTLSPGDTVIVRSADPGSLRLGDIVLWRTGKVWLAHRLIGRRRVGGALFFITKGDNCSNADDAWHVAQLQGVVVAVRHSGNQASHLSYRTRALNFLLALLSRAEWHAYRLQSGWFRTAALRGFYISMRAGALLAHRVCG